MLTGKQERFAQLIASEDISQVAAYIDAGYSSTQLRKQLYSKASALALGGEIVGRVAELREAARKAAGVTRDGHLAKLAEIRDMALDGDKYETPGGATKTVRNYGAAVQAEGLIGKHSGVAAADKHLDVTPDVPAEDAIKELCTQPGQPQGRVRAHFKHGTQREDQPQYPYV